MTPTDRIRELNDAFRRSFTGGRIVITKGIAALPASDQTAILEKVRTHADFEPGNDPYSEHDFGAFDHEGVWIFWKFDAYDQALAYGSPDPADPSVTTRVLTVMLAEEY